MGRGTGGRPGSREAATARADKKGFDPEVMADVVAEATGCDPAALKFTPTPTGKYSTSYFVEGWERPLVIRIAPPDRRDQNLFYEFRMMRQEPEIHAVVRAKTGMPVPEIVAHAVNHPAFGRDYLLMERMPGKPISDQPLTRESLNGVLRELGRRLKEVHAITRPEYGYAGAHAPMEAQRDWASAFAIMWHLLLDDIERCGGYSAEEAGRMRKLHEKYRKVFDRPVASSLLHMDIWAENILCNQAGKLTGLLDWDRGLWGDPEIEFAVLGYCGISEPAFWEGYGSERDTSPAAQARLAFYFLYELQKYIFIRIVRSGSRSGAEGYRRQSLALASRLE